MKRNQLKWWSIVASAVLMFTAISCHKESVSSTTGDNPFDITNGGESQVRNKIVVISDIHLGNDLNYAECVAHLPRLVEFLTDIRESKTVSELVIAGDLLDEWYIPSRTDTYEGKTQKEFIQKIATQNKGVIDVLNGIIKDENIKVTYVPGNHDLIVQEDNVELILPGINQA
ncbi:MAG TPA: hypothetical protein DF409_14135, partial [Bacteroidales bacterium]|nr:hypothetical protein [Bacteroidales bacterium]